MAKLKDLPHFDEMASPEFGADVPASARALFARGDETGLMRFGDDALVAFGNAALTALAATRDAGNIPPWMISEEPALYRLLSSHIFTMNPPLHGPHRKLFARHFTAKESARYAEISEAVVDGLIAEAAERETIDFRWFGMQAPARFWSRVLGMTHDEEQLIADLFLNEFSLNFLFERTDEQDGRVLDAAGHYMDTISPAIMRSLNDGGNDLLNAMAEDLDAIEEDGRPENVGELLGATLADGFHTLGGALTGAVYSLVSRPDVHERVRDDPGLAGNAFDEGSRLDPPLIMTFRYSLADIEHAGVEIPEGTLIYTLWMYGNRDPRAFDDPDAYDLARPVRHMRTFGGGQHICPGRNVSRVLGSAVIAGLTAPDVRITPVRDAVEWVRGSLLHEPTELPVAITKA